MVKVGVLLSGCGVLDGAEIHEAVLVLLALDRAGARIDCVAPNVDQLHVIDHLSGEVTGETRNVLVESARIARGSVRDVASAKASQFDALILPGGFGAAKNLCDFATAGAAAQVHPEVGRLVGDMLAARKPIGAACIAPAVLATVLRDRGEHGALTIGNDESYAQTLRSMGAEHLACPVDQMRVDEERRIVTTPAYMLAGRISEAAAGIERMVAEVLRLAR